MRALGDVQNRLDDLERAPRVHPAAAKQVKDMIEEVDRRMNDQLDMLMNVCLQAYQRFQQTTGNKLNQRNSLHLGKMASMRSMRSMFDDAAKSGISRASTISSADFAKPAVNLRKEANIIRASGKSMNHFSKLVHLA